MAPIDRYRRIREQAEAEGLSAKLRTIEDQLWYGRPGSQEPSVLAEELGEARRRGEEERQQASLARPDLLILCVGYSPEPLLLAVAYHAPAHVAVLKEMHLEEEYLRSLERLWDSHSELLRVPKFTNLAARTTKDSASGVFLIVREIAERWREHSPGRIVLDISGAKKSMIAGAFLAGGLLDLEASYVDFDDYDVALRRPLPGSSRPGELKHPYQLFKLREESRLGEEFGRWRFHEAENLAATLRDMARHPDVADLLERGEAEKLAQRYEAVGRIARAYALWSDGFYQESAGELAKCPGMLVPATVDLLAGSWPTSKQADKEIVQALHPRRVFREPAAALAYFLDVLVWNAEERIAVQPRDCYLRLYGTIESVVIFVFQAFVGRCPERMLVEPPSPQEVELRSVGVEACEKNSGWALKVLAGKKLPLGRPGSDLALFTVSLPTAVIPQDTFLSLFSEKGGGDHLQKFSDLRHQAVHWLAPVPQESASRLLKYYRRLVQDLIPLAAAHLRDDAPDLDVTARSRLKEWEGRLLAAAAGEIPEDCKPMAPTALMAVASAVALPSSPGR